MKSVRNQRTQPDARGKGLMSIHNAVSSAVGVGAGEGLEGNLVRLQDFAEEGCDDTFVGKLDLLCGAGGGMGAGVGACDSSQRCGMLASRFRRDACFT